MGSRPKRLLVLFQTDDDILDIDADDHTCLPLWTHLRKHETLRRHHLHEEVDEEDESQPGLLPGPAPPEQRPGFKRSVSTMARRPCVLATRRLSLWLAGRSSEELAVESPSSGTLAALDIARSKLTGAGARRYLDSLHASSSRTRLMSHQFDTNMWVDDPSINGQVLNSHVTLGLGKTPFDQTHTEVYALPIAMAARAGGTLRKLASRLTTALMRRTDKQAMAKEKKATKLVAMILGTCGTFRENRQKCFHLALLSYGKAHGPPSCRFRCGRRIVLAFLNRSKCFEIEASLSNDPPPRNGGKQSLVSMPMVTG